MNSESRFRIQTCYVGAMLNYMIPWFKNMDLLEPTDHSFAMNILFRATIDYGTQYADQITRAWKGLTFKRNNISIVLNDNYVLQRCEFNMLFPGIL